MILKLQHRIKKKDLETMILPVDQVAKKSLAHELAPAVSNLVNVSHVDDGHERIYTAEVVVLHKSQLEHIEAMAQALAWCLTAGQQLVLQEIINEIKYK